MNRKITQLLLVSFVYYFLVSSFTVVGRPTYALDPDNIPSFLEGYEMMTGSEVSTTTDYLETYTVVYVTPTNCWPITEDSPNCVSMLAFSYTRSVDEVFVGTQDEEYFETIKLTVEFAYIDEGFEDVTDEIPCAVFAYIYFTEAVGVTEYTGISYIGYQTGLILTVAEGSTSLTPSRGIETNVLLKELSKNDVISAMKGATELAADVLGLGDEAHDTNFVLIIIISSSIIVIVLVFLKLIRNKDKET